MITLTKTINKLPKNPLLKTNKGEHRLEMNIKTRTGNHQQASPQGPPFLHFFPPPPPDANCRLCGDAAAADRLPLPHRVVCAGHCSPVLGWPRRSALGSKGARFWGFWQAAQRRKQRQQHTQECCGCGLEVKTLSF